MSSERIAKAASIAALALFFIALLMSNAAEASTEALRSDDGTTTTASALPAEPGAPGVALPLLEDVPPAEPLPAEVPEPRPLVLILSGLIAFGLLPEGFVSGQRAA